MKKCFCLFMALFISQQLAAQVKTWNGSVSTDWYNAANWTPSAGATAGAPTATDNVFITIASPDPIIASGNAVAKSINMDVVGSSLTINSGATLTVSTNGGDAVSVIRGTLTNNGTLSATNTAGFTSGQEAMSLTTGGTVTNSGILTLNGGENVALNIAGSTFTNQSGGNVTSNGRDVMRMSGAGVSFTNASGATFTGTGTNTGIFAQPGSITNAGTIHITGSIELYNNTVFTNSVCGKFKVTGSLFNQIGSSLSNAGFLHVTEAISNNGTATNTGVMKSASGTIPNSGNASVRVNDTPTPIFTYGGASFSGTVNGIFKDEAATASAGTFTDSPPNLNAFIGDNTLPLGSQTLYAKITPAAGGCVYIVPFLFFYTPPPVFTTHPANVAVCSGSSTSFTVVATDAVSYQWQISTNGGANWTNLSNNSIYTNVTTATLNISNSAGLGSSIYRCVATNTGGPTNSNSASITLNPSTTPSSTGTITWTGAISTDWNTPCNWSPGSVPTVDNEVLINNVVNDPVIASGITATTGFITLSSGAVLTVNSGGILNVRGNANDGMRLISATFTNNGTTDIQRPGGLPFASGGIFSTTGSAVNNGGTLTVNSNGAPLSNGGGTFAVTNNSGGVLNVINGNGFTSQAGAGTIRINITNNGTINSNCSSINGFFSFINNGTVNINTGGITVASSKSLTNNACGKIIVNAGNYTNAGSSTNAGFIHVINEIYSTATFNNTGILKYGTVAGTIDISNTGTSAIIVKDSPTPIFTYGGASYSGIVDGIYTDALATNSAGTFTPLNSFVPDAGLPIGSQTLYAKITPSVGGCFYIVPFIYVVLPNFTAQPSNVTKCSPEAASFAVTVNQATSYQWQLSTNGGANWSNITANAIYTNVTTTTLNISNTAGLHNYQYRCVATNVGGSVNSNAATLTVITGVNTPTGTLTWTGTFGTDWSQACNWSPASVPAVGNDVVIPNTTNDPIIGVSTNAVAKSVEVQSGALLTIAANGTITVNGSRTVASIAAAFHNIGTTENNGIISIGTTTASGTNGLLNKGNFNNNAAAELRIDNATSAGLNNNSGTFNNVAKIIVGFNTSTGSSGVSNSSTFNNQATGEIRIDRTTNNGFANSTGGTANNYGKIIIGATAALTNNGLLNDAAFNNNAGGEITLDRTSGSGLFQRTGTFTNAGKITLGSIAPAGGSGILVDAVLTNAAAGEITITATSSSGIYNRTGTVNNAGLLTIVGSNSTGLRNSVTFNNQSCGKLDVLNGVTNDAGANFTNLGYTLIGGSLSAGGTFTNNGVLKKSASSGTIINATNPSLIVNNNPTNSTVFTYGGTYDGIVNGIFTDANAGVSAGTYTQAANTFAPLGTLPVGSQTLYAKITPSGGGCFYVVPFTYVMAAAPPTFTTQPVSVSLCAGAASFTVAAANATSYQWQLSTNGGGAWANISAAGVYTNVTTTTLNISNIAGLNGNQYRCVATGAGGPANSNAATLLVSSATLTLSSPADDISTNAGTKQATQSITATNKLTAPAVVTYRAGSAVTLSPGFEARNGVTFLAQIGGCN
jgi:trimeric autotransporter adhesin